MHHSPASRAAPSAAAAWGVLDRRQYGCIAYHKRGRSVCRNTLKKPIAALEAAVLQTLSNDVPRPAVMRATLTGVLAALAPTTIARDLTRNQRELTRVEREISNLMEAIAQGGQLTPLLAALTARQDQLAMLSATVAAQTVVRGTPEYQSAHHSNNPQHEQKPQHEHGERADCQKQVPIPTTRVPTSDASRQSDHRRNRRKE
jgi:hypothetical protein